MSVSVSDPEFWKHRLYKAHASGRGLHTAIYDIDSVVWEQIQEQCHGILVANIGYNDRILDAGCGYGALVSCLHSCLRDVYYCGIDSSPDLIEIARIAYPQRRFEVCDINQMPQFNTWEFDWVVCRSMKNMICRELDEWAWFSIELELLRVAKKLLIIEYEGEVTYEIAE